VTFTAVFTPTPYVDVARADGQGPRSPIRRRSDHVPTTHLESVLRHQRRAVADLGARIREVDRSLAVDDGRGLDVALAAVGAARDRTSALELTRCLALLALGASPDLPVEAVGRHVGHHQAVGVVALASELRDEVAWVERQRRRTMAALSRTTLPRAPVALGWPLRA
jgi:hypothetical protein